MKNKEEDPLEGLSMTTIEVVAKSRKLKTKFNMAAAQNMQSAHGDGMTEALEQLMEEEIRQCAGKRIRSDIQPEWDWRIKKHKRNAIDRL